MEHIPTYVKIISNINSLSDLENDINKFIANKSVKSIQFVADMGRHTALIHYTQVIQTLGSFERNSKIKI